MTQASAQTPFLDVIAFWFSEVNPDRWFAKDPAFDALIRERFASIHDAAARCELDGWRVEPLGRLAEVIVLDQFSRNLYRQGPQAFASDPLALGLAQEAVRVEADQALSTTQRAFLYLPYMHSESLAVHRVAAQLFSQPGLESNAEYERQHVRILERFGRYPSRNAQLGRMSTPEELAFLREPGSSF